jgi:hypothetical protein
MRVERGVRNAERLSYPDPPQFHPERPPTGPLFRSWALCSAGRPSVGSRLARLSPVEVVYVPRAEDVPNPSFEVALFKEAGSAARFARSVPDARRVEQRKNVVVPFPLSPG